MRVCIAWIGDGSEPHGLIASALRAAGRAFMTPAEGMTLEGRPPGTLDAVRQQHSSRAMLAWLAARAPDGAKLLGVTDLDLFIPVLTFVFGEAQLRGGAAVVSIARLHDTARPGLMAARLAKEAVHELGHTLGLVHCTSASCVMARSAGLAAVDRKSDILCADCRIRYRESQDSSSGAVICPSNPPAF